MPAFLDITGQRFFRLTALSFKKVQTKSTTFTTWLCQCDCGNTVSVIVGNLRSKRTKSCGCWNREFLRVNKTHGMAGTRLYGRWAAMLARCKNLKDVNYAGRGIRVCERWTHSFASFLEDMGPCPSPHHEIERIDNDGDYTPENCRWATRQEQANNKRNNHVLAWNNQSLTIAQWSRKTGIPPKLILDRLSKRHWTIHDALTKPVRKNNTRSM